MNNVIKPVLCTVLTIGITVPAVVVGNVSEVSAKTTNKSPIKKKYTKTERDYIAYQTDILRKLKKQVDAYKAKLAEFNNGGKVSVPTAYMQTWNDVQLDATWIPQDKVPAIFRKAQRHFNDVTEISDSMWVALDTYFSSSDEDATGLAYIDADYKLMVSEYNAFVTEINRLNKVYK